MDMGQMYVEDGTRRQMLHPVLVHEGCAETANSVLHCRNALQMVNSE